MGGMRIALSKEVTGQFDSRCKIWVWPWIKKLTIIKI